MNHSPESDLRGDAAEDDASTTKKDPDAELHLDDEKDTLYDDGLDVEDDSETLAGTKGNVNRG